MFANEDFAPLATMADAHREWHLNAGVPMGTPGCPQDACHPVDEYDMEPGEGEGVRCGRCKGRHWTVADVRFCYSVEIDHECICAHCREAGTCFGCTSGYCP